QTLAGRLPGPKDNTAVRPGCVAGPTPPAARSARGRRSTTCRKELGDARQFSRPANHLIPRFERSFWHQVSHGANLFPQEASAPDAIWSDGKWNNDPLGFEPASSSPPDAALTSPSAPLSSHSATVSSFPSIRHTAAQNQS